MKLPRFVMLYNPDEQLNDVVMETSAPYFLGKVYKIDKRDEEQVEQTLADIANGRRLAVKIEGYTIFVSVAGTLDRNELPDEEAREVLRDMADFYRGAVLLRKKGKHRCYQEGVPIDIDHQNHELIKAGKDEGRMVFVDRR